MVISFIRKKTSMLLAGFSLLVSAASAQHTDSMGELKRIFTEIKNIPSMSYDYQQDFISPDGRLDNMKGQMNIDHRQQLFYNNADVYTIILTDRYFYKADHRKRMLLLVDMKHHYDQRLRKKTLEDFFNGSFNSYTDTSLLQKVIIKELNHTGGVTSAVLAFPESMEVSKIILRYDEQKHMPLSYEVNMRQLTGTRAGKKIYATIHIKCNGFIVSALRENDICRKYFTWQRGRPILQQYGAYRLKTNLDQ